MTNILRAQNEKCRSENYEYYVHSSVCVIIITAHLGKISLWPSVMCIALCGT